MIPKKIKATLEVLGIVGVVNGYFTQKLHDNLQRRLKGESMAAFTAWDDAGQVVCVLVKGRGDRHWRLK